MPSLDVQKTGPDEPTSTTASSPAVRLRAARDAAARGLAGAEHSLRALLTDPEAASDGALAAEVCLLLGDVQFRKGALDQAISTAGEARQRYVIVGDLSGELSALRLLGMCWTMLGDLLRARAVFSLGAELARAGGLVEAEAVALCNNAMTYGEANEHQACADLTREALVLLRQLGDVRRIAHGLVNYAEGLTRLGRLDEAEVAAEEGAPSRRSSRTNASSRSSRTASPVAKIGCVTSTNGPMRMSTSGLVCATRRSKSLNGW